MLPLAPVANTSDVKRDGPVAAAAWPTEGHRPGHSGKEDPAGAPQFLDFVKMPVVLKDLDEKQFRDAIRDTMQALPDLGLNRDKGGEDRAQAYLDMATWDAAYRTSWTDGNTEGTSSCGMVVRNIWWLCGLRGLPLFDNAYSGGILTSLSNLPGFKRFNSGFTSKTFHPKIGDALYLFDPNTKSQHVFIICGIDKEIREVEGVATVFNEDGTLASVISFTSVDGGQGDGTGKDSRGKSQPWNYNGIQQVTRQMTLKDGRFLDIGTKWLDPSKAKPGRPINTWIPIWALREKFTAQWIKPLRRGKMDAASALGGHLVKLQPLDDKEKPALFPTWPTYKEQVPASILEKVKKNRDAYPIHPKLGPYYKDKVHTGYSYGAGGMSPRPVVLSDKDNTGDKETDARVPAVLERLYHEMGGEGGVSAVMTGDNAKFTWGRGLAHGGSLEGSFFEFLERVPAARQDFFDCGIQLDGPEKPENLHREKWAIVDLQNNRVQFGTNAMDVLNGKEPSEAKQQLLSIFIAITEKHLQVASQAQWDVFKRKLFPPVPKAVIKSWDPETIGYVIHCNAWGNFAGWEMFQATGGDLKKILRLEVDFTGYYEDKGKHLLVPLDMRGTRPSLTMLTNMGGHRKDKEPPLMLEILLPWQDATEMAASLQDGDVVFQMEKDKKPAFYCLRGTQKIFDRKNKHDEWVEDNHALPMGKLLEKLDKLGKKEVLAIRDRYVSANNPNKGKWGLRPQIAMEAVLHKNEGFTANWLFEQLRFAGVTAATHPDQYAAVANMIGLGKYDAWVEKNHPLPMDYLVKEALKLGYDEACKSRAWYTSDKNQKKQKYGLRPRVVLDAAMNKGGGEKAAWILNDCEVAGIGQSVCPDQYAIIKQTIGA